MAFLFFILSAIFPSLLSGQVQEKDRSQWQFHLVLPASPEELPYTFIHEPWMATNQVQKAAKCVIGKDYPLPMVDHASVAKLNQERMRQVYRHLASYRSSKMPGVCALIQDNFPRKQQSHPKSFFDSVSRSPFSESLCTVTLPQVMTSSCYEHSSPPATQQSPVITSNSRSSISVGTYSNKHQTYFPLLLPPPPLPSTSTAEPFMLQEAVLLAVTVTGPFAPYVVGGTDENNMDLLVLSIKSYQPQVVRVTLQRDRLLQQAEKGYSLSESECVWTTTSSHSAPSRNKVGADVDSKLTFNLL